MSKFTAAKRRKLLRWSFFCMDPEARAHQGFRTRECYKDWRTRVTASSSRITWMRPEVPRQTRKSHYAVWVRTVQDSIAYIAALTGAPPNRMAPAGYSRGAMVALATAVRRPELGAVIAISGSLPDKSYRALKALPPLLIVHGREDELVPVTNANQLAALC